MTTIRACPSSWASSSASPSNKAGLTKYHKIVNVFRFTDMAVLKFMMTALVVAMIGSVYPARPGLDHLSHRSRHLHRRQPGRRPDLRRGHGAGRVTDRVPASPGAAKANWITSIPGFLGFLTGAVLLRPDLSAGIPSDSSNRQLRQRSHPGPMEPQPIPDRIRTLP